METDTGRMRLGTAPMGLGEADNQEDDLRRRILDRGGYDGPMRLGEADSRDDL
jgi:hypothetical protein